MVYLSIWYRQTGNGYEFIQLGMGRGGQAWQHQAAKTSFLPSELWLRGCTLEDHDTIANCASVSTNKPASMIVYNLCANIKGF